MGTLALALTHTLINGSRTLSLLSNFGTELIITSITTSSKSIISLLNYLSTSNSTYINKTNTDLKKLDLEFVIGVIHQLIIEQNNHINNDSIKFALHGVSEVLVKTNEELITLKTHYDEHNKKYFNNWRPFSYDITNINEYHTLLLKRYDMLIKLLQIYNKIN